MKHPAKSI